MVHKLQERLLAGPIRISTATPATVSVARVREDLREMLTELSEALLDDASPIVLLDAVRHAFLLVELAELGDGLVAQLLRNLNRDLRNSTSVDAAYHAERLKAAAEQIGVPSGPLRR